MVISSVYVCSPVSLLAKSESCSSTAFDSLCVGSALGERDIYSSYLPFRMLWLLLQDTAFILECQDAFRPKVPVTLRLGQSHSSFFPVTRFEFLAPFPRQATRRMTLRD